MHKICIVTGGRPNLIKIPLLYAMLKSNKNFDVELVHTGQHYDSVLVDNILEDFNLDFDICLNISNSDRLELSDALVSYLAQTKPDLVIVIGDMNSSFAAALASFKNNIKILHLEAGAFLPKFENEEGVNRFTIDMIADIMVTPYEENVENIKKHRPNCKHIYCVGQPLIDVLLHNKEKIMVKNEEEPYGIVTLHRRENLHKDIIENLLNILRCLKIKYKIKFFMHPHLIKKLNEYNFLEKQYFLLFDKKRAFIDNKNIKLFNSFSYLHFLNQMYNASFVITDSGGAQQEAMFLGVPCVVYRTTTEHYPLLKSSIQLLSQDYEKINDFVLSLNNTKKEVFSEEKWGDGKASERIYNIILNYFEGVL